MLFAPLEAILNRNIAASSAARATCKRLAGKTLALHFQSAPENTLVSFYLRCADEQLSIVTKCETPPNAALFGTPLAYLNMVRAQPESTMRSGAVRIEGDAEAAQAFRNLLNAARPDVEEELSRVIGDVAAHQLGNLARGAIRFGERVANTFAQNVSEYLQEESRDVVTRIEIDEFTSDVDRMREAVDRVEARLSMLERNIRR